MSTRHFFCASILACIMAVGCEKKETPQTPPPTAPPAPQATGAAAAPTADAAGAAAQDAAAKGTAASSEATAQAQKLLDQAMQYIKDQKWDLADTTLSKLEGMKAQLPPEWAGKIDGARKAFNAAKASGAIQVPGGPGK